MNNRIKGTIVLGYVTVAWNLGWRHRGGDTERDYDITLSTSGPIALDAMAEAYHAAVKLERCRQCSMELCPSSDSMLEVVGIDDLGDVILQVWKGDRKCSAAPSRELAHIDPAGFSDSGAEAQRCVAWMRDTAKAYRDASTLRELRDMLYAARTSAQPAVTA